MRVLTGMQPSGNPHLGNFLGAMQHHINLQKNYECYFFIADLHALTTVRDSEKLKQNTLEVALDYLALGVDPEKTAFFRQSDISAHTELSWIFNCITPMGLLERCHAWKEAISGKRKEATVGLFGYPILMAADILLYKPNLVPVGKDQKQHVEVARDIALKFNQTFGEVFPLPEPLIDHKTAVVPGTDGQKMSKSYGNVIELFAPEQILRKQVMMIKTDSTPIEAKKEPSKCIVFTLYSLLANQDEIESLRQKYLEGGFGYAQAKKILFDKLLEILSPYRQKRIELQKNIRYVNEVLIEGAKKAKFLAEKTMQEVRSKVGLSSY